MKTRSQLIMCALFLLPACGPAVSLEDGDGSGGGTGNTSNDGPDDGQEGSGTDAPVPLQCNFDGTLYEEGEQFSTPDGCVTFACASGALTAIEDNRTNVAGDLELSTQELVDAQTCLGVVEGNLTITGTAADMSNLAQLTRVGGNLIILGTQAVTLQGFGALGEVAQSVVIADNANLTAMAFQPYMSVFGDVTIQNNDQLTSLAGAEFIGQCGACAAVDDDGEVAVPPMGGVGDGPGPADEEPADPAGDEGGVDAGADGSEPQGGTFYGNILIADNDALTDVFAMSNLYFAWADVRFRNNASLTGLANMQLSEVQGDLEITEHATMVELDAQNFAAGIDVWGQVTICGNVQGVACPP